MKADLDLSSNINIPMALPSIARQSLDRLDDVLSMASAGTFDPGCPRGSMKRVALLFENASEHMQAGIAQRLDEVARSAGVTFLSCFRVNGDEQLTLHGDRDTAIDELRQHEAHSRATEAAMAILSADPRTRGQVSQDQYDIVSRAIGSAIADATGAKPAKKDALAGPNASGYPTP